MECFRCGNEPCTCTKTVQSDKRGKPCVLKACSHPGCFVMIRWPVGQLQGDSLCKWHRGSSAHARCPEVRKGDGPAMTKEEFGLDLYEAIRLNAARLQCEARGKTTEAKAYQDQLQAILPKIANPDDVRRILDMR